MIDKYQDLENQQTEPTIQDLILLGNKTVDIYNEYTDTTDYSSPATPDGIKAYEAKKSQEIKEDQEAKRLAFLGIQEEAYKVDDRIKLTYTWNWYKDYPCKGYREVFYPKEDEVLARRHHSRLILGRNAYSNITINIDLKR